MFHILQFHIINCLCKEQDKDGLLKGISQNEIVQHARFWPIMILNGL